MTTTEPTTTTVPTAELDALRAIARAATVIAAGEHVDRHERDQALDALPHLCDALAAETSSTPAAYVIPARTARERRRLVRAVARARDRIAEPGETFANGGMLPAGAVPVITSRRAQPAARQESWLSRMGALGALSPDHQAAYEALAQAGVQPYQLRFLATAVSCGVIAPTERGTRP